MMARFLSALLVAGVICIATATATPVGFPFLRPTSTFTFPTPPPFPMFSMPVIRFSSIYDGGNDNHVGLGGGATTLDNHHEHEKPRQLSEHEHGVNRLETSNTEPDVIFTITTINLDDDEDSPLVVPPKPTPTPPTFAPFSWSRREWKQQPTPPTTPKPKESSHDFGPFFRLFGDDETPKKVNQEPTPPTPAPTSWRLRSPWNLNQSPKSRRAPMPMPMAPSHPSYREPSSGPTSIRLPITSSAPAPVQQLPQLQAKMEKLLDYQTDLMAMLESSTLLNALNAIRLNQYVNRLNAAEIGSSPMHMAMAPPLPVRSPAPAPAPAPRVPFSLRAHTQPPPSKLSLPLPFSGASSVKKAPADTATTIKGADNNESDEFSASITKFVDSMFTL